MGSARKREKREREARQKTRRTKTESKESSLPLVSLTECRQLIEINVLSGWAEGGERSRLAARELDA